MKTLRQFPIPNPPSATAPVQPAPRAIRGTAFSLIEILAVVGLMSVIIIGLMAMFSQTQRAFRLGMTQTDVLEAGRMATDLIVRELEQTRPAYVTVSNIEVWPTYQSPNFAVEMRRWGWQPVPGSPVTALGDPTSRTNILDDLFFVTRQNQTWTGIGYFVRTNASVPGGLGAVGSLYRYETNQTVFQRRNLSDMFYGFKGASLGGNPTNVSKVLDGVVHFRLRAFNLTNEWIAPTFTVPRNYWYVTNICAVPPPERLSDATAYYFCSNAVPAFVELELGVLEPQIFERYKSLPTELVKSNYLMQQAAHVHLFRQRIPIRNVDRAVYNETLLP